MKINAITYALDITTQYVVFYIKCCRILDTEI